MCPALPRDARRAHLTRGRANTLRLALTGQLGPEALASDEVQEALSLCVSCKGCKRECPTGVDMAKMKIEALARAGANARALAQDRLIADLPRWAPFAGAGAVPGQCAERHAGARRAVERLLGFAAGRRLPRFRRDAFRDDEVPAPTAGDGEVSSSPTPSTAISSRRTCAPPCACWPRPAIACAVARRRRRPAAVLRPHLPRRRDGRGGARRGARRWRGAAPLSSSACRWSASSPPAC